MYTGHFELSCVVFPCGCDSYGSARGRRHTAGQDEWFRARGSYSGARTHRQAGFPGPGVVLETHWSTTSGGIDCSFLQRWLPWRRAETGTTRAGTRISSIRVTSLHGFIRKFFAIMRPRDFFHLNTSSKTLQVAPRRSSKDQASLRHSKIYVNIVSSGG